MSNRIMGIDYGQRRIGVAISDERNKFALPLKVVNNTSSLINDLKKAAEEYGIKEIVLGESLDYKGEPNIIFKSANELKHNLEAEEFIVHYEPEFMTSVHAERLQGKHDMIDASAAAIILQTYLDKVNG